MCRPVCRGYRRKEPALIPDILPNLFQMLPDMFLHFLLLIHIETWKEIVQLPEYIDVSWLDSDVL